jgi:hypothetical protein
MTSSSGRARRASSDGAVWCKAHDRRECAKNTKRGGIRCHQIALAGLDACKLHSGESLDKAKARGKANLMRAAFAEIPAGEYVDPGDVLLWAVTVSARQVAWLRGLILDRMDPAGTGVDDASVAGLVRLEQEERSTLTRAAKMALDAGIAERQIRMAERVAEQLIAVLRGVVTELGHDAKDPKVAAVCRRHLQLVTGQGAA